MGKYPGQDNPSDEIERIYRLAAEGDCNGVMAGMSAVFPYLRQPSHEKRLVASIARGRAKEIAHVQD